MISDLRPPSEVARRARRRLPDLPESDVAGIGLIRRAARVSLIMAVVLFGVGLAVAAGVRVRVTVPAAGVLEPERVWPARSLESGAVLAVHVRTGDSVAAGQLLARLDTLPHSEAMARLGAQAQQNRIALERTLRAAPIEVAIQRERIAQADAERVRARSELLRHLTDFGIHTSPEESLATYRPGESVARDDVVAGVLEAESRFRSEQARAELLALKSLDVEELRAAGRRIAADMRFVRERLRRGELRAPRPGVVLTEQVEQLVGATVNAGDLLFEVADVRSWQAVLRVRQSDVNRVQLGDTVRAEIPALLPDRRDPIDGTVTFVASEPLLGGEGGYRVLVDLDSTAITPVDRVLLRRGYDVNGIIVTRSISLLRLLWRWAGAR